MLMFATLKNFYNERKYAMFKKIYTSLFIPVAFIFFIHTCVAYFALSPPPFKKKKIIVDIVCKKMF